MTITAICPCGTPLKAPDHLAGKAVKCPKCTAVVKLPAANGTARVPAAAAAHPPASNTKPLTPRADMSGAATRPLGGASDVKGGPNVKAAPERRTTLPSAEVPPELNERLMKELMPKEKILWVGQPIPKLVFRRQLWALILAPILFVVAGVWSLFVLKGKDVPMMMLTGPLVFLAFGIGLGIYPFIKKAIARKTFYLLTNKRAIIWALRPVIGVYRDVYQPAQLVNIRRENAILVRGAGDVIFRTKIIIRRTDYYDRRGGYRGSDTSRQTIHYGFLAVDRPQDVERLIRETLLEKYLEKLEKIQEQLNKDEDEE
jgi:hypothetical protein